MPREVKAYPLIKDSLTSQPHNVEKPVRHVLGILPPAAEGAGVFTHQLSRLIGVLIPSQFWFLMSISKETSYNPGKCPQAERYRSWQPQACRNTGK